MVSKAEYLYAKKKRDDLRLKIADFEAHSAHYSMWVRWTSMTKKEQEDLRTKWAHYYKVCRDSYYGKKYQEARLLLKNWTATHKQIYKEELRKIVDEVKESDVPFVPTPSTVDPDELGMKLEPYFEAVKRLKEFDDIFEEYHDVYEPKNRKSDDIL